MAPYAPHHVLLLSADKFVPKMATNTGVVMPLLYDLKHDGLS
jgi:hypothetical protein